MPRRLGQHFLYDPKIAAKMCEAANVGKGDIVLEIGPGKGLITKELSERAKRIIAVEEDEKLANALKGKWPNVEIINGDILDIAFPYFDKIVSNIPFEISSPLLEKIFESRKLAVLILQKEFSGRLVAKPGERDYSRLTVKCNYFCSVEKVSTLKPGAFKPAPKVTATIVKLTPKEPPFKVDDEFWDVVHVLFQHKKKTVGAVLKWMPMKYKIPEELARKRVFQCDLTDLKKISDAL